MFKSFVDFFRKKSSLNSPERWLINAMGGQATAAGTYVSEDTALRYTDVLACVMLISKVRALLKPKVYRNRKSGVGRDFAYDHYLNDIIQLTPNDEVVGFSYRESELAHLLTWGNAYTEVAKNAYTGRIVGLYPVHPGKMRMNRRLDAGGGLPLHEESEPRPGYGEIWYEWNDDDGNTVARPKSRMLHIAGFGGNLIGKSMIGLAREAIGMGMAVEEFGARFFGSGTHPGAVVSHPKALSDDGFNRLKRSLDEKYSGLGKAHRLLLLEEGMSFQGVGIPANDAQFIETRQLNREQICSIFGVPPHMIAALERATFNNIEAMDSGFITRCIVPWLERLEDYYSVNLLTAAERRQGYEIRHDTDNLLRGDFKTRSEGYQSGINAGWLSRNEAREKEGLNPVDGLDRFLVPVNMMASDDLGKNIAGAAVAALDKAGE